MIESATGNSQLATSYLINYSKTASVSYNINSQTVDANGTARSDQVSLSYQLESSITYSETGNIDALVNDSYELLRTMVQKVFHDQGLSSTFSAGETEVDLDTLSQEDAEELIAEDGYFGVEKTSERIVQFAIGVAGGDPARINAIREGVDKGFQEAYDAFGGWLPDISYDTYDAVMQKLNDWVEGFDQ